MKPDETKGKGKKCKCGHFKNQHDTVNLPETNYGCQYGMMEGECCRCKKFREVDNAD